MSSSKRRLEQIDQHIRQPSQTNPVVDFLCTTQEYKPGHNVATITFSNPTKLNVATGFLLDKLIAICKELGKDDNLRAVVLTGAPPPSPNKPPSFIGGADIQELSRLSSPDEARTYITRVHKACEAVSNIPVPVIARVHGFALGAGLELMASCDLKIATKASQFGMPEVKIGLPSLVEAALFPGQIGMGRTKRLIYLAENISAEMALDWGLIEELVQDEAALDRMVDDVSAKSCALAR
jgi:enoyl-CoA hydratase